MPDLLSIVYNENNIERITAYLEIIRESAKSINDLLNDFTNYVNNKTEILNVQERVNIEDIFCDKQFALKEEIFKNSATIITNFKTSEIIFSRYHLRSILYNFLSNAIKYKNPNKPLEIVITTEKIEGYILLSVKDNGLGINEKHHKDIFNKFIRLSTKIDGTGMGLFIIKSILENNGGKVEINSTPGIGSTFNVFFKSA
jgi:two-component system phosphate regulon sensor histidine kinase PhoR